MANVQLAKNLKTLRKKYNYTQQDVSTFLNITRQAYSHYEQALREPDLNTLVHLSRFYQSLWTNLLQATFMPTRSGNLCPSINTVIAKLSITSTRYILRIRK